MLDDDTPPVRLFSQDFLDLLSPVLHRPPLAAIRESEAAAMANLAALLAEEQDRLDQLLAASREADDGAERALTDFLGEQESGPISTGARS